MFQIISFVKSLSSIIKFLKDAYSFLISMRDKRQDKKNEARKDKLEETTDAIVEETTKTVEERNNDELRNAHRNR